MQRRIGILVGAGIVLLVLAGMFSATRGWGGGSTAAMLIAGTFAWTIAVVVSWRGISRYLAKRSTRYGLNAFLLSFLVAVILFMIGFIADRHGWRKDMSAAGEFTLSEKTLNVLQGIRKRIDIYVYYERGSRETVRDLLVEYARRSRGIRIHMEDLNKNPGLAERYGVTELGTLVFDASDKVVRLKTFGEEDITNALIKVSRPGEKKVFFLTGHGEKDVENKGIFGYSIAAAALRRENYDPQPLSLTESAGVPSHCDVLVVAGAKSGLLDQEIAAIHEHLQHGGRLFALLDPRFRSNLEGFVARWGILVGEDLVIDASPAGQLLGRGPATPLVSRYGVHPITKQFRQPTYFQNVRSVRRLSLYQGKAETASLAFTGDQSWADQSVRAQKVSFDEEDLAGPVSIAMAARIDMQGLLPELDPAARSTPGDEVVNEKVLAGAGKSKRTEARLVVFGDSDFANNQNFNDMGNGNLFLNCVAWLSEDEELIALRPKRAQHRSISLTLGQIRLLNIVSIGVLPGLAAGIGLLVTIRRRSRG